MPVLSRWNIYIGKSHSRIAFPDSEFGSAQYLWALLCRSSESEKQEQEQEQQYVFAARARDSYLRL